jgi:hypothetical protein
MAEVTPSEVRVAVPAKPFDGRPTLEPKRNPNHQPNPAWAYPISPPPCQIA